MSSAATARGAVGVDADQRGRRRVGAGHQVEAEVADVGAAGGVDDHVVEVPAAVLADVGVLGDGAVRRPAQDPVVAHRDDEQRAVRHPARAPTAGPRPRAPPPRDRSRRPSSTGGGRSPTPTSGPRASAGSRRTPRPPATRAVGPPSVPPRPVARSSSSCPAGGAHRVVGHPDHAVVRVLRAPAERVGADLREAPAELRRVLAAEQHDVVAVRPSDEAPDAPVDRLDPGRAPGVDGRVVEAERRAVERVRRLALAGLARGRGRSRCPGSRARRAPSRSAAPRARSAVAPRRRARSSRGPTTRRSGRTARASRRARGPGRRCAAPRSVRRRRSSRRSCHPRGTHLRWRGCCRSTSAGPGRSNGRARPSARRSGRSRSRGRGWCGGSTSTATTRPTGSRTAASTAPCSSTRSSPTATGSASSGATTSRSGQFGENFTVEGLADDEVCIGDRYRIGAGAVRGHPAARDVLPRRDPYGRARRCRRCSSPTTARASTSACSRRVRWRPAMRSSRSPTGRSG